MADEVKMIPDGVEPIEWLKPDSEQHRKVLDHCLARLKFSENAMSKFYSRWRSNEMMLQAYIGLNDYDTMLREMQTSKEAPGIGEGSPVAINVPFAWATVNTIVTYLLHMFAGRRPIFQVSSYNEKVDKAKNMEMFLQYNADVVKFIRALYFFLMDGETYGVAVMRTLWRSETKTRSIIVPPAPEMAAMMQSMGRTAEGTREQQPYTSFEGSSCTNIDPFMFFPDPRVPMHEVNEKGEWVIWRAFMGKFQLLKEQAAGRLKWVEKVGAYDGARADGDTDGASARGMRAFGDAQPGNSRYADQNGLIDPNIQIDQGTFEIVPKDLGLGDSEIPEKWLFTIANKRQILQAVRAEDELPGGKHPVIVAEPNSVGYAFGQLGTVDILGPMQGMMSWFMNSHIYNVRASLNNMFVVDPTKIEMKDLTSPKPGKIIRMKNTAFGLQEPKNAIQQLAVSDVTRSHLQDFQMFGRLASDLTGATDNVRGLQDAGGRKTATEIRTSAEAGTSRLAAKGKVYSAMAFTDLAEMWAKNAQQNLTMDFEMQVLGQAGVEDSIRINSETLAGDFIFPVHDGTLPIDKVGLLDVWKEIYSAVLADPQLRQSYDILSMFDWIAQLGGAQNIKSFRMNVVPQTQQMDALQGGAGVPLDAAMAGIAGAQGG